jgi:hypothetical protein
MGCVPCNEYSGIVALVELPHKSYVYMTCVVVNVNLGSFVGYF